MKNLIKAMNYQGIHLKPVLAAVGNLVVKSVKRNFIEGGRPDRWTPSNKPKGKTLIGTGALMKSIHVFPRLIKSPYKTFISFSPTALRFFYLT